MRFQTSCTVVAGAVGVDPRVSPASVSATHLIQDPGQRVVGVRSPQHTSLTMFLDAPTAETVTFSLYTALESKDPTNLPSTYIVASTKWAEVVTAQTVTAGTLYQLAFPTNKIPSGLCYVRVTGDTLTGGSTVNLYAAWG